jgi:putative mRNA 3-end processing factor
MLLRMTGAGLYCEAGDFHIDPWRPVPRAVVTHAHSDHARWGCGAYLGSEEGERVLRTRLGPDAPIRVLPYGDTLNVRGVRVSLHPAGHILGSAQVRVERGGEVWVVSGDYKSGPDTTCTPFEPVRCHTFITESTFGLPIYRWPPQEEVFDDIGEWWRANADAGRTSVLFGYALGKAQRLLAGLLDREAGPILCHGAVERLNRDYRDSGIDLPETSYAGSFTGRADRAGALVVAPPSAAGSGWLRRFGESATAFASGWMRVRGTRRRRGVDRGFVLSDHVDWPALVAAVEATGAARVWVTHGYRDPVVRWLRERGIEAEAIPSRWEGESDDEAVDAAGEGDGEETAGDEAVAQAALPGSEAHDGRGAADPSPADGGPREHVDRGGDGGRPADPFGEDGP